jgi:hypothetical protein
MALYKITIYRTHPESSVTVYEDNDNHKAAYEKGMAVAVNIFGEFNSEIMFLKIEQDHPA